MKRIKEPSTIIKSMGSVKATSEDINLLPVATTNNLGAVKIGSGVTVTADGTISVGGGGSVSPGNPTAKVGLTAVDGSAITYMRSDAAPALDQSISPTWTGAHTYNGSIIVSTQTKGDNSTKAASTAFVANAIANLPQVEPATTQSLGVVKIGDNINVQPDGTISVVAPYTLPTASANILGGIKVGSGLSIDGSGIFSATGASLQPATATTLGGVKIGANVNVTQDGTISVAAPYTTSIVGNGYNTGGTFNITTQNTRVPTAWSLRLH
ncbi:MAG: hypothetical protein QM652_07590 [Legionella sp.]|uniref:hypothetical protein n=1 Tax=Legionella sp. TaxID=459 RepID=UPI0039E5E976